MSFNHTTFTEETPSCLSFTISQSAPGALLQFQPPLHSKELAEAIHNYIPGPFTLQEKQRQISSDFCFWRSKACPEGPASYFFDASPALEFSSFSTTAGSSFNDQSATTVSKETSTGDNQNSRKSSTPARRSRATKVIKKTAAKAVSSGPRLPGLSIMTKDGVDITDAAPRGPKTKEQREHAALMRKLQACPTCRRRKQRCNPSHHTQNSTSSSSSSATAPSRRSSAIDSKASTPASSAVSGNSPIQTHTQEMQISQTGQHFNETIPPPKTALTPSDFASIDHSFDIPSTLESAGLDMGPEVFDPSFFDQSFFSTGFEDPVDQSFVDSVFDFNSWSNHEFVIAGSNFSGDSVSSQTGGRDGSILPHSSQGLTPSTISSSNTAGQFTDFVPAWDSGSSPYVPANGSRLQSPDEFGVQSDFSQVNDRIRSRPNSDHQFQESDMRMNSLFGDGPYSSPNFSSPEILTPTSISTNSSSQGHSVSTAESPYSVTQHVPIEWMYSPRPSALTHSSTVVTPSGASHVDSLQLHSLAARHHDTECGMCGKVFACKHDLDRHISDRGPVHTRPQMVSSHGPGHSTSSLAQTAPQNFQNGSLSQSIVSRSTARAISSISSSTLGELQSMNLDGEPSSGSEERRMAPVIQYSWGSYSQRQPDSISNASQHGTTVRDDSTSQDYQMQLMEVERQGKGHFMMARPEPSDAHTQSHSPPVIPLEQSSSPEVIPQPSSRPFRLRQVEDSSSARAEVQETTPQLAFTLSGNPEVLEANHRADVSHRSQQELLQRRAAADPAPSEALVEVDNSGLRARGQVVNTPGDQSGMTTNASGAIEDRNAMRTEAHQHAAVRSQTRASLSAVTSEVIVKKQQMLPLDVKSNTTLQGLLGLVLCSGLTVLASQFSICPIYALLCITSAFFLREAFSTFIRNGHSIDTTLDKRASRELFESAKSGLSQGNVSVIHSTHLSMPRVCSSDWLRAMLCSHRTKA